MTEGLAQLWRLSLADPRLGDLTDNLSAACAAPPGAPSSARSTRSRRRRSRGPLLARGAWFTEDGYTQMDHQRHPLSGLLATLAVLEAESAR